MPGLRFAESGMANGLLRFLTSGCVCERHHNFSRFNCKPFLRVRWTKLRLDGENLEREASGMSTIFPFFTFAPIGLTG